MKEIDKILNNSEKIIWEGKPIFWPFILGRSMLITIFGIFWMLMLIPFIAAAVFLMIKGNPMGLTIFLFPHFWIGIVLIFGIPLYNFFLFKKTFYAITDRRIIIQKGVIGRDFEVLDFDQITNMEVRVGLIDKIFNKNTGSILVASAGTITYGRRGAVTKPYTLGSIVDPYTVFKTLKQISHDIKTDIQYPNKLRPEENPGYTSEYKQ